MDIAQNTPNSNQELYIKSMLAQLLRQFELIYKAIGNGHRACDLVLNMTPLVKEKMTKLGYEIIQEPPTPYGQLSQCKFIDPVLITCDDLQTLVTPHIYNEFIANDEKKVANWDKFFFTAKEAHDRATQRRVDIANRIALVWIEAIYEFIQSEAESGKVRTTIYFKHETSGSYGDKTQYPSIHGPNGAICDTMKLVNSINRSKEFSSFGISVTHNMYTSMDQDIKRILADLLSKRGINIKGKETTTQAKSTSNNYLSEAFTIDWSDGEEYVRNIEKYQPGGEGYEKTKEEYIKHALTESIKKFAQFGLVRHEKSHISSQDIFMGFKEWLDVHPCPSSSGITNQTFNSILAVCLPDGIEHYVLFSRSLPEVYKSKVLLSDCCSCQECCPLLHPSKQDAKPKEEKQDDKKSKKRKGVDKKEKKSNKKQKDNVTEPFSFWD